MKKALVLFLVLAVVAGGLFAQEGTKTWSGGAYGSAILDLTNDPIDITSSNGDGDGNYQNFDSNFKLKYTHDAGWDLTLTFNAGRDNNANNGGIAADLNYNKDNYGFTLGARQGNAGYNSAFEISTVRGYFKFMDGDMRVDMRIVGGGDTDYWRANGLMVGHWDRMPAKVQLNYTGIDKLAVGAIFPYVFGTNGQYDGFFFNGGEESVLKNMNIGAKYTDDFVLSFNLRLTPATDVEKFSADLNLGFSYADLAIEGLNLDAGLVVYNLLGEARPAGARQNSAYNGTAMGIDAGVKVSYGMDAGPGSFGASATFKGFDAFATQEFSANINYGLEGDLGNNWSYNASLDFDVGILPNVTASVSPNLGVTYSFGTAFLDLQYNLGIDITPTFDVSTNEIQALVKWTF